MTAYVGPASRALIRWTCAVLVWGAVGGVSAQNVSPKKGLRVPPAATQVQPGLTVPSLLDAVVTQPLPAEVVNAPRGDRIVAVVNSEVVTAHEFTLRLQEMQAQAQRQGTALPPLGVLRQQALESLIKERAVLSYARQAAGRIDDTEVDRAVANVAAQNQLGLDALREQLREEGSDLNRFRQYIRDQLAVERVREREVQARIRISESEIDEALAQARQTPGWGQIQQTRVRHILLRPSAQLSAEAAAQRLAQWRQAVASGASPFEDLARQYSEDGSAAQGGDLGWVVPGAFVPEFEEAMDGLSEGGLSEPVRSRFGVHLIQVLARRPLQLDARQQREQLRGQLRAQAFEQAFEAWVNDLRQQAWVEIRDEAR